MIIILGKKWSNNRFTSLSGVPAFQMQEIQLKCENIQTCNSFISSSFSPFPKVLSPIQFTAMQFLSVYE